jgi:putative pyoverdin transport system ATP-binding/permease protein
MELFRFLLSASRRMLLGLFIASVLAGASSAALLAVIHRALIPGDTGPKLIAAAFVAALAVKLVAQYVSQVMLVRFAQQIVLELCRDLCDRVLATPLDRLEALGTPRLLATLNDDVTVLSGAVLAVPMLATNAAVLAGCAAYLAYLSLPVFGLCVAMVVVGVAVYRLLIRRAQAALAAAREGRDRLFGNFQALIHGVKELKLHARRRAEFVQREIDETTELLRVQNVAAVRRHLVADVWNQFLFFLLVALLLFGAPALTPLSSGTLTGYVFAALYMMAPMWALIGTVPVFMRGRVSLAKIRQLDGDLDANALEPARTGAAPAPSGAVRIELNGARYAYPTSAPDDPGFVLGPIDLRLDSGEIVLVTGGNGCGKSTLVRLLTGLYRPAGGTIRCNGALVDDSNRDAYRQHFSVVFADFFLFDRLFGMEAGARTLEIERYLALLGMEHKVSVRGDRLSSTALSSGQRRRLALLTAYLEDRAVYVFDEWAADQDPTYKQVFYTRLLPELKARGKCVVVVTHDDRYFEHGDRVLRLEAGRFVPAERAAREALAAAPQA